MLPTDLPKTELLAMLAEEAAELAQAALKYRRALDGTNPTPKTAEECAAALVEEMADVDLCFMVFDDFNSETADTITEIRLRKFIRWSDRLRGRPDK